MAVIHGVDSLKFTKSCNGVNTLVVEATQSSGIVIEHCLNARHYMGAHLEYLRDESLVHFVIQLKYVELRYVFSKSVDLVRVYSSEIAELMGF